MKVNRLLVLILVFTLLGVATVVAVTDYEKYLARKLNVTVNGTSLNSGLMVDINKNDIRVETPMASIDEIVKMMGGIVSERENGLNIYKPNVQLRVTVPKVGTAIQQVEKGKGDLKRPIVVFAALDNIFTKLSNLKITVVDPYGHEIESDEYVVAEADRNESFNFTSNTIELRLKSTGKYMVNLYVKEVGGSEYYKVGQVGVYCIPE